MAWCRVGDKPLSEPMVVSLLTHICVTRPQWVNHYSHVTWASWHLKSSSTWFFFQKLVQAISKENMEVLHYWLFVRGIHQWHKKILSQRTTKADPGKWQAFVPMSWHDDFHLHCCSTYTEILLKTQDILVEMFQIINAITAHILTNIT